MSAIVSSSNKTKQQNVSKKWSDWISEQRPMTVSRVWFWAYNCSDIMPCMINSCSSVVEQWNPVEFGIANWGLAMVLNIAHSRVFFLSILNSLWCYSLFSQNCQIDLWFPDTRVWVNVVTCLVVTVAFICQLDSISCSDNTVFDFHKAF